MKASCCDILYYYTNIHTKGGENQYHLSLYCLCVKTRNIFYYKATPRIAMYSFRLQRALSVCLYISTLLNSLISSGIKFHSRGPPENEAQSHKGVFCSWPLQQSFGLMIWCWPSE